MRYAFLIKLTMDDKTTKKWLAVIRRYVDTLPDGYLKREFYEDIVQEIFCRFFSSYGSRLHENICLSVRLHTCAKNSVRLLFRSLQKLCEREYLCAAPPREAGISAEWAKNAAMQGNYLVEMWLDLQTFASVALTSEEKAIFFRMYSGLPLEIASLGKEGSRQAKSHLYSKLRGDFARKEGSLKGFRTSGTECEWALARAAYISFLRRKKTNQ